MLQQTSKGITRLVSLSTSLHFSSLAEFKKAGDGAPQLSGQTTNGLDNGYGLQGNPTCHELQDAISQLENGKYTLLYPSGLTAIIALGGLLNAGDHWLLPDSVYGPARRYASYLHKQFGVGYDIYDPSALKSLRAKITSQTKLIHIETPGSVTFQTTSLKKVAGIAKRRGIITSADNTWASGVLCNPLDYGVDIVVMSLTKYVAGYSDVFMGSVTTRNKKLFTRLAYGHRVHGYTVSPVSAMLVQRGLESLAVRLAAHGANAAKLVQSVRKHPLVARLYYADAQSCSELRGLNGLFSLELPRRYDDSELEKPLASLKTFKIGESWGGTRSLVLPFQPEDFAGRMSPPTGTVVRFHSGLEDITLQLKDVLGLLSSL